jgi:tRNA-specific 2-thiouridylase
MSGGVDSAVAALLLKREGHEVVGIHLRTGVSEDPAHPGSRPRCCGADEAIDARRVAAILDIPFYVQNTEKEFSGLIGAFSDAYVRGETPNPCIACNTDIKFGALLERAQALGMDAVATGHYARRVLQKGRWALARARDTTKDQSYVLYGLGQKELERSLFPLGDLRKQDVRRLAREAGLPVADKAESQEICFVPSGDYRDVVRARRPDAFGEGEIVDEQGRRVGTHEGVAGFTVGQRRGLGIAGAGPLYVLALDPVRSRVVVGPKSSLGVDSAEIDQVSWSSGETPENPFDTEVALRYRAHPVAATVTCREHDRAELKFREPAWPVTPGQSAVFYDGDLVLGGGRIRASP